MNDEHEESIITADDAYDDPLEPVDSNYVYCGRCEGPVAPGDIMCMRPIRMDGGWWMRRWCECPCCGWMWTWFQACSIEGIYDDFIFMQERPIERWEYEMFQEQAHEEAPI